jgi:protein SCO1
MPVPPVRKTLKYSGRAAIIRGMPALARRGFASRSTLLVLCAAFAAGLGLYLAERHFGGGPRAGAVAEAMPSDLRAVRAFPTPRVLDDWRLTRADGQPIGPAQLHGRWTVVFLGFTHCPDVCPTTLAELAKAQARWAGLPEARRPRLLFVSVDPERDTPKIVGEYARYFHADTWAATADPAALERFAKAMGLVYMKVPLKDGDYTMDHSATLVVLDPRGRQVGLIGPPLKWNDIAADLSRLASERP